MPVKKGMTNQRGFSLVELLVVVVIILVVSALAIPNIAAALNTFRLRGTVSSVAGLLQESRILSVKMNRVYQVKLSQIGNANVAYVDLNNNNTPDNAPCVHNFAINCPEPLIQGAQSVTVDFTGPSTAFPSATLLGYTQAASTSPFQVGFNQRGVPCTGTIAACASNNGFLYYFRIDGALGTRWAALTVTPAGRIRVWTLSGTTWN